MTSSCYQVTSPLLEEGYIYPNANEGILLDMREIWIIFLLWWKYTHLLLIEFLHQPNTKPWAWFAIQRGRTNPYCIIWAGYNWLWLICVTYMRINLVWYMDIQKVTHRPYFFRPGQLLSKQRWHVSSCIHDFRDCTPGLYIRLDFVVETRSGWHKFWQRLGELQKGIQELFCRGGLLAKLGGLYHYHRCVSEWCGLYIM